MPICVKPKKILAGWRNAAESAFFHAKSKYIIHYRFSVDYSSLLPVLNLCLDFKSPEKYSGSSSIIIGDPWNAYSLNSTLAAIVSFFLCLSICLCLFSENCM